jgi:hypothetical protein
MAGEGDMHDEELFWHERAPTTAERRTRAIAWVGMLALAALVWTLAIYGAWRLIGG